MMPADVTCCEAPSAPVQRTPVPSSNANEGQLKLAIQPFVTLLLPRLCVKPPVLEKPVREINQSVGTPLVDRICIRLI